MRLIWATPALTDRRKIYSRIGADNPKAALDLDELFERRSWQLSEHPMLGRVGRMAETRELVVHPNYLLIYEIDDETVWILRVLHAAMKWPPKTKTPG
ncbi:translation repressor RelE [Devosia geojensis]|uniref:Translation repressor RelE n=1 Tax=Devosia geojensis TaxID=443610 RepID=A0A0F5FZS6_9HYPH|nr:type II toxin-antitoxin system mRNA interferase toxin, RelE/StbE family [Devosia geojensis]KKB13697.1 translation repressor RelE [Devosia geojensis]